MPGERRAEERPPPHDRGPSEPESGAHRTGGGGRRSGRRRHRRHGDRRTDVRHHHRRHRGCRGRRVDGHRRGRLRPAEHRRRVLLPAELPRRHRAAAGRALRAGAPGISPGSRGRPQSRLPWPVVRGDRARPAPRLDGGGGREPRRLGRGPRSRARGIRTGQRGSRSTGRPGPPGHRSRPTTCRARRRNAGPGSTTRWRGRTTRGWPIGLRWTAPEPRGDHPHHRARRTPRRAERGAGPSGGRPGGVSWYAPSHSGRIVPCTAEGACRSGRPGRPVGSVSLVRCAGIRGPRRRVAGREALLRCLVHGVGRQTLGCGVSCFTRRGRYGILPRRLVDRGWMIGLHTGGVSRASDLRDGDVAGNDAIRVDAPHSTRGTCHHGRRRTPRHRRAGIPPARSRSHRSRPDGPGYSRRTWTIRPPGPTSHPAVGEPKPRLQ